MKRLTGWLLALALTTALAVPAAAEAYPQSVEWTDYAKVQEVEGAYLYQVWDAQGHTGLLNQGDRSVTLPCAYEDLRVVSGDIWAMRDGKWGLLSQQGGVSMEEVLPFAYDTAGSAIRYARYADRDLTLIAAQMGGKWGYVNTRNEIMIPFVYEAAEEFQNNTFDTYAIVKRDGKWGVIDPGGIPCVPVIYDELRQIEPAYQMHFAARSGGKWGVVDLRGQALLPIAYDSVEGERSTGALIVSQGGRYGFAFQEEGGGTYQVGELAYDMVRLQPNCRYAAVQRDGKWGAMDWRTGAETPCVLDNPPNFVFYLTPAGQNGSWSFQSVVEREGGLAWETALAGPYEQAEAFVGDYAPVKQNGKWGLIDGAGRPVLPCEYDSLTRVEGGGTIVERDGLTWGLDAELEPFTAKAVQTLDPAGPASGYWKAEIGGKYGLYSAGQVAAPFEYGYIGPSYGWGEPILVEREGRWGFLRDPRSAGDEMGLTVQWLPQFQGLAGGGGPGRVLVQENGLYGLASTDGTLVVPPTWTALSYDPTTGEYEAQNGEPWSGEEDWREGLWGRIDENGAVTAPFQNGTREMLRNGVDAFAAENGLFALMDRDGNLLTPYQYEYNIRFEEGLAVVRRDRKAGVLDRKGREVIPCVYEDVHPAGEGRFAFLQDGLVGFIGADGAVLLPPKYAPVTFAMGGWPHGGVIYYGSGYVFRDGLCAVYLPDGEGREVLTFIDAAGETVAAPDYSTFQELDVLAYGPPWQESGPHTYDYYEDAGRLEPQGDGTALFTDGLGNRLVLSGYVEPERSSDIPAFDFPQDYRWIGETGEGYIVVEHRGTFGLMKDPERADDVSDWAKAEVDRAKGLALVTERTKTYLTYNITRLQFAELAVNLAEKWTGEPIQPAAADRFTDTADLTARKAAAAGIVSGTGDGGTFSPDAFITREQIAVMLCRTLGTVEEGRGASGADLSGYTDAGQVSSWAAAAVAELMERGIMRGTSESTLSPRDDTTVEQAILLVLRAYDIQKEGDR